MDSVIRVVLSKDLLELADHLEALVHETAQLKSEKNSLYSALRFIVNSTMQKKEGIKRSYRIYHGCESNCAYLYTYWNYTLSPEKNTASITKLIHDLRQDFAKPCGKRTTIKQVKEVMSVLEANMVLFNKDYGRKYFLDIVLVNNTYREYNSKISVINYFNGHLRECIFASYVITETAKPPEVVFLHELGHAIHHQLTGSVSVLPEGFRELTESLFSNIHNKDQLVELFADLFSITASKQWISLKSYDYIHAMMAGFVELTKGKMASIRADIDKILNLNGVRITDELAFLFIISTYFKSILCKKRSH